MLEEGVADAAAIDAAMSDGLAPRWMAAGPLATADLGGLRHVRDGVARPVAPPRRRPRGARRRWTRAAAAGEPLAPGRPAPATRWPRLRADALAAGPARRRAAAGARRVIALSAHLGPSSRSWTRSSARPPRATRASRWSRRGGRPPPIPARWAGAVRAAGLRAVHGERRRRRPRRRRAGLLQPARSGGEAWWSRPSPPPGWWPPPAATASTCSWAGSRRTGRRPISSRAAGAVRAAADAVAAQGVPIVVEHLNAVDVDRPLLPTPAEAAAFVERVGHPGVRVLFDAYHAAMAGLDPLEEAARVAPPDRPRAVRRPPRPRRAGHGDPRPLGAGRPARRARLRRGRGAGVPPRGPHAARAAQGLTAGPGARGDGARQPRGGHDAAAGERMASARKPPSAPRPDQAIGAPRVAHRARRRSSSPRPAPPGRAPRPRSRTARKVGGDPPPLDQRVRGARFGGRPPQVVVDVGVREAGTKVAPCRWRPCAPSR